MEALFDDLNTPRANAELFADRSPAGDRLP